MMLQNLNFSGLPPARRTFQITVWMCVLALVGVGDSLTAEAQDDSVVSVVVTGYERFQHGDGFSEEQLGVLLLNELGCRNCHEGTFSEFPEARQAPILTRAAERVSADYLREYIRNPHRVKPGTAMPQLDIGSSEESVEAIVHFLKTGGVSLPTAPAAGAIQRGEVLFHQVGCVACHGPVGRELPDVPVPTDALNSDDDDQDDDDRDKSIAPELPPGRSMPLGAVDLKYTIGSLSQFLRDPHAVRPTGRMPSLNLTNEEAIDIASFLLRNVDVEPNLKLSEYHGRWDKLPDFDEMEPAVSGGATEISVAQATRKEDFGLRFEGFLQIAESGIYRFRLASDDGSRLVLNGQTVIDHDGVHGHSAVEQDYELEAGAHAILVDYFEASGGESIELFIRSSGRDWQPVSTLITANRLPSEGRRSFEPNPELAATGRRLFVSGGCAACHLHDGVRGMEAEIDRSRPMDTLSPGEGCLGTEHEKGVPHYGLSSEQRHAMGAAIAALRAKSGSSESDANPEAAASRRIANTMLTFNCYACHRRSERGGVHRQLDGFFTGTIPEMGDEGRIPPHLDGVGDKLREQWLRTVMDQGAGDRHYMHTRMPKFGGSSVGNLVADIRAIDERTEVDPVSFSEPQHRVKADARFLVGDQSLGCIKCHSFNSHKATGIQALEMTSMTRRLRRDWFHRYLIRPLTYRPQTRMPSAWPGGRSVVRDVLEGDSAQQMEAIWQYLADGASAKVPAGLVNSAIELKPEGRPRIYRNFIQGLSARGIAVGYPEGAHLAYDAEAMTVRFIWHGAYIDAARHWVGRGQGFQEPLGDHVLPLVDGAPLAKLQDESAAWPTESSRSLGFKFLGYRLDAAGRPTFRYRWNGLSVAEHWQPLPEPEGVSFVRTLTISGSETAANGLFLRIASGESIESAGASAFQIDGGMVIEVNKPTILRPSGSRIELIVPIRIDPGTGEAAVSQTIRW